MGVGELSRDFLAVAQNLVAAFHQPLAFIERVGVGGGGQGGGVDHFPQQLLAAFLEGGDRAAEFNLATQQLLLFVGGRPFGNPMPPARERLGQVTRVATERLLVPLERRGQFGRDEGWRMVAEQCLGFREQFADRERRRLHLGESSQRIARRKARQFGVRQSEQRARRPARRGPRVRREACGNLYAWRESGGNRGAGSRCGGSEHTIAGLREFRGMAFRGDQFSKRAAPAFKLFVELLEFVSDDRIGWIAGVVGRTQVRAGCRSKRGRELAAAFDERGEGRVERLDVAGKAG